MGKRQRQLSEVRGLLREQGFVPALSTAEDALIVVDDAARNTHDMRSIVVWYRGADEREMQRFCRAWRDYQREERRALYEDETLMGYHAAVGAPSAPIVFV